MIVLVPTGNPPSLRFGHPDVTTDDTAPPRVPTPTGACRCTFRKRHQGTLSGALRSEARRGGAPERVGSPVGAQEGAHRSHPWVRRGTRTNTVPPATAVLLAKAGRKLSPSCRSCPAAHSHEREPNAPRSAPHPASNQCWGPPRRCRCAPPARAQPNRQCR